MSDDKSPLNIKSYKLITDNLIKEALKNDNVENPKLVSFEIQDFTNKGDGYMSVVTGIIVKYKENEILQEKNYIAKLNPLRPQSSINDITEELFHREIVILSKVIEDMNKQLELLGLSRIKTPKLFASNFEKGKEAFIAENLRTQGFILHDRRKGQDLNHALLVVEELGRFHASSLLLEESIAPKTFLDTYEHFEESWMNIDGPGFKTFDAMFKSQAEGAIKVLNSFPKYEKCLQWVKDHGASFGKYFLNGFTPCKPFEVLIHGDSWTNNMLFKYDGKNNPVDMRFVDLQCSRKASPVCDILYFFYSSVNGDVRSKYFNDLLRAYYRSFCRVLDLAKKKVPFTYKELEVEAKKRKLFGYVSGLMVIQGVLFSEGDEIWDFSDYSDDKLDNFAENFGKNFLRAAKRESPFKDRFLSIYDDILESGFLEEQVSELFTGTSENHASPNAQSYEAINDNLVRECLQNDKGKTVEFLSYEIKDFTNKGDGYTSIVTSVLVKYKENGQTLEKSYVAKINPNRPSTPMSDLMEEIFPREAVILTSVIGGMNQHLEELEFSPVKTPKVFSSSMEKGREVFLAENLRTQGFSLFDRRKGQDFHHALLVMEELGRFHASSLLLEESIAPKTFEETYEHFKEPWLDANNNFFKAFESMVISQSEVSVKFLQSIPKYEKCVKWLKTNKQNLGRYFIEGFKSCKPFDVLAHGDCWTNNMLFKYNSENMAVDLRLVDLQCARKASPASDIVYFFYSSLSGEVRSKYFKKLLFIYYQSLSKVLFFAGKDVPFTFKELENEVNKRKILGLIIGMIAIPNALTVDDDEIMDLGNLREDNKEEFKESLVKNFESFSKKEGPFKDRFLSLFDDMLESQIFEENGNES